jgi:proliferating cell nuclear antigen PCNA
VAGIRIMNVDPTKSILISVKLYASQFQEFICKESKYEIGVSLLQLNKILKTIDKDDIITLCVDNDNEQFLVVSLFNNEKRKNTEFKLKLMDLDPCPLEIPATEIDVIITMGSNEFHKICRNMGQIAEYVEIKCTEKNITFSCKGECSEQQTSFGASENGVKITYANNNKQMIVQGIYELQKLNIFTKCASLSSGSEIQLFMKNDYPLSIKYTVATLGKFIVSIVPVDEKQTKNSYSDEDEFYESDNEEIKMKNNTIKNEGEKNKIKNSKIKRV